MITKLNGINAEIELFSDKLVIKKSWFLIRVFISDKVEGQGIGLNDIKDINYKEGTNISNGSLNIKFQNSMESIKFKRSSNKDAEKIFKTIKSKIDKNVKEDPIPTSGAREIREYKELYDDGIITKEEFEKKKNRILNS